MNPLGGGGGFNPMSMIQGLMSSFMPMLQGLMGGGGQQGGQAGGGQGGGMFDISSFMQMAKPLMDLFGGIGKK